MATMAPHSSAAASRQRILRRRRRQALRPGARSHPPGARAVGRQQDGRRPDARARPQNAVPAFGSIWAGVDREARCETRTRGVAGPGHAATFPCRHRRGRTSRVDRPDSSHEPASPPAAPTERLFRTVVESSPSGMVMVDRRGTIVLVNRETERLFGYTPGRAARTGRSSCWSRSGSGRAIPALRQRVLRQPAAPGRWAPGATCSACTRTAARFPVEIGLNPIETEEGLFVLASVVDIGPRKQAEEELRRSNEELERFAYVASHDLQEPLRTVASYVQLLVAPLSRPARRRRRGLHRLRGRRRPADAASHRGPAGLLPRRHARRAARAHRLRARSSRARSPTCTPRIEESHADGDAPIRCRWCSPIAGQLAQLLTNLIGNALKFRGTDAPRVHIERRAQPGGMWTVSVRDNGIGIEPEYFERIFVIFQRLHGREEYPGTGDRPRDLQEDRGAARRADLGRVGARAAARVLVHASGRHGVRMTWPIACPPIEILLVEDNPADVRLTAGGAARRPRCATVCSVARDGVEALPCSRTTSARRRRVPI